MALSDYMTRCMRDAAMDPLTYLQHPERLLTSESIETTCSIAGGTTSVTSGTCSIVSGAQYESKTIRLEKKAEPVTPKKPPPTFTRREAKAMRKGDRL